MAFILELATYEDIDTLLDVYFQAFAADGVYRYLYPNLTWEEKIKFEASGPKRVFREQPWVKLYKVTEENTGYATSKFSACPIFILRKTNIDKWLCQQEDRGMGTVALSQSLDRGGKETSWRPRSLRSGDPCRQQHTIV